MRLAETTDTLDLIDLYQEAVLHANSVGLIDWPNPITPTFVTDLIDTRELYCFGASSVTAAGRISRQCDYRIWQNESDSIYLAKLATRNSVRCRDYFNANMLPEIIRFAGNCYSLRLECLANNPRLHEFYRRVGFVSIGNTEFFSEKQNRVIKVTRFEKLI